VRGLLSLAIRPVSFAPPLLASTFKSLRVQLRSRLHYEQAHTESRAIRAEL
jgi:hypothetical protein